MASCVMRQSRTASTGSLPTERYTGLLPAYVFTWYWPSEYFAMGSSCPPTMTPLTVPFLCRITRAYRHPFSDRMYFVRIAFWFAIFGALYGQIPYYCTILRKWAGKLPKNCERNQTLRMGEKSGGEGGIRTPDTLSGMPVFKTGAINHSATSPYKIGLRTRRLIRALLASLQQA